jgi:hypothetical protein
LEKDCGEIGVPFDKTVNNVCAVLADGKAWRFCWDLEAANFQRKPKQN